MILDLACIYQTQYANIEAHIKLSVLTVNNGQKEKNRLA